MGLENRVVVVSGASGGLGQVVARSMAEQGARLVLLGRKVDKLEDLARNLKLVDDRYLALGVDLDDLESTKNMAAASIRKFGKVDILLQLVGGWTGGNSLMDVNPDDVAHMLQQHLWTTFHLTRAFVPNFIKNGWGRVIVVSSPFAANPRPNGGPYAIGKAAQETLMLTLAQELKGTGVTANIITVKTIDVKHARDNDPSPKNASWTTPVEISDAISYLVSDAASMVNGARLPLYGGP